MTTDGDRPLIFLQNPTPLQKRAAVIVAAELWRIEISQNSFNARSPKHPNPSIKSLVEVPKTIETMIDKCIIEMMKSIICWLDFHYSAAFCSQNKTNDITMYWDFLEWHPDGEVNRNRTAKNLMMCSQLSQNSKYKLACLYCFEDDIRKIWDTLACHDSLENVSFDDEPLLYYWTCCMKNELWSIETRAGLSLDAEMIERVGVESTWSSFVYFWKRLQPNEQVKVFVYFVERFMVHETRLLIQFLTETQLKMAISQTSWKFIVVFVGVPESEDFILQTWRYMKNSLTVDAFIKGIF